MLEVVFLVILIVGVVALIIRGKAHDEALKRKNDTNPK
jgi:hypothetical protein